MNKLHYRTPVFIIPKKEGTVKLITDYFNLNQDLVREPYSFLIICDTIKQLDWFLYTTALDINMGY